MLATFDGHWHEKLKLKCNKSMNNELKNTDNVCIFLDVKCFTADNRSQPENVSIVHGVKKHNVYNMS